MHTYFFDVSDIVQYIETETSISGIQRVSLEVIRQMLLRYGPERVKMATWDRSNKRYHVLEADFLLEMDEFDPDVLSAVFFGRHVREANTVPPFLARYRNKRAKYLFHLARANIEAMRGNQRYFERRGTTMEQWPQMKAEARKNAKARAEAQEAEAAAPASSRPLVSSMLKEGDRLVINGATWGMDDLTDHFVELKEDYNVHISLLVYDLIPLLKPEHIAGEFSMIFYRWLKKSTRYCARYFVISEHSGRDLADFMKEIGATQPIDPIPLVQTLRQDTAPKDRSTLTFEERAQETLGISRSVLNLPKMPFVLVVGTIESRKNLWRLAHAWARLIEDRDIEVPKLVFAGKLGWYIEDFKAWMEASGNMNGWIEIAEKPTDKELAFLYERCEFTAMVSLYEGWGLPIGEGLGFGKTAVVANNSSMPEVGGDMVEYCDAESIDSIYQACRKLITDRAHRATLEERIRNTKLRTWEDVAADFVRHLDE